MSKKYAKDKSENRDCLKQILSSIRFLTRQGISCLAKNRHQRTEILSQTHKNPLKRTQKRSKFILTSTKTPHSL